MTRSQKFNKLANAVRACRGLYDVPGKRWVRPPQPAMYQRVQTWLERLQLDVPANLRAIAAFKSMEEFHTWLAKLH